jgi:hypothetical protein
LFFLIPGRWIESENSIFPFEIMCNSFSSMSNHAILSRVKAHTSRTYITVTVEGQSKAEQNNRILIRLAKRCLAYNFFAIYFVGRKKVYWNQIWIVDRHKLNLTHMVDIKLSDLTKKKLRGLSPQANYTYQATAACRRSWCQLLRLEDVAWSAQRIPTAVNLGNKGFINTEEKFD